MSHKQGYYTSKIRKKDGESVKKITSIFKTIRRDVDTAPAAVEVAVEPEVSTTKTCDEVPVSVGDIDVDNTAGTTASKIDMRGFSVSCSKYFQMYQWLYFNHGRQCFMCKTCEYFGKANVFTKGVPALGDHPSRLLESHRDGKCHTDAGKVIDAAKTSKNVQHMFEKKAETEKVKHRDVITKLLKCTNFLVRRKWAISENFEIFVKFVSSLGIPDLLSHIENAPHNATYLSAVSVSEFLHTISTYVEDTLLQTLRGADFFSLLADESTDESGREQLSIYGRWNHHGNIQDHYLGLVHIEKADSKSLTEAIQQFFIAKNVDLAKVRFLAFDGASAMSGEKTGVQRRLRNVAPHSIYMNCRCHKLALCLVHLMKIPDYAILLDVDSLLLGLWKLFEYSPRKFAVFSRVQGAYGKHTLQLIKAATTRWLSHGAACSRIAERYLELVDTLDALYDERREPEVMGLRISLLDKDNVGMIFLLSDVLRIINKLSLFLQKDGIDFSEVPHRVQTALSELDALMEMCEERAHHKENLTFSLIDEVYLEISHRTTLARRLRPADVNQIQTPEEFLRLKGFPFIRALKGELEDQFVCSPILKAIRCLDPKHLPEYEELGDYGKADMRTLAEFYGSNRSDTFQGHVTLAPADFDSADTTYRELETFKTHMYMEKQRMIRQGLDPSLATLFKVMTEDGVLGQMFPRVQKLLRLAMLIPCSTAAVERGFSLINGLCTVLRNRVSQSTLDALMRVCREGKEEFATEEWDAMVNHFKNKKERKIDI